MLLACVLSWKGNWEDHLTLAEFAYNNSYHASIKMEPYESLCGRKCISPLCWEVSRERLLVGNEWLQQTHDKVHQIRRNMLTAQSRQKSYIDVRQEIWSLLWATKFFSRWPQKKELFVLASRGSLAPDTLDLI
jgi:hypothetical protein